MLVPSANKRTVKWVGFVILGLIGLEIMLRLFFHDVLTDSAIRPPVYRPDSVVNYTYIRNFESHANGKSFHFNSDGFIGAEFPPKSRKLFRIAVCGDSWVSGSLNSLRYSTFTRHLQDIFDQCGYNVEVLNCGVDGKYRGYDLLKMIDYKILDLEPDLILLEYTLPLFTDNTVRESYGGYFLVYPKGMDGFRENEIRVIDRLNKYKPLLNAVSSFYITKAIFKCITRYGSKDPFRLRDYIILYQNGFIKKWKTDPADMTIFTMEQSEIIIKRLKDSLRSNDRLFYLFSIQANDADYRAMKAHSIPCIYMGLTLSEESGDVFPDDGHPTPEGNQKIAHKLFNLLIKHKLIPLEFCREED